MEGSAEIKFIPGEETKWQETVGFHAQEAEPAFRPEQVVPAAAQPVQNTPELRAVKAVRPDAEPDAGWGDIRHIVGTTAASLGTINPDTYDRTTSGRNVGSLMRGRLARMREGIGRLFRRGSRWK